MQKTGTATAESRDEWLDDFLTRCSHLAENIRSEHDQLVTLLSQYETFQTVEDEIERALSAIEGFRDEFKPITQPLHNLTVATFFPINLPLYSLVLFGIAPSAFARHVFIRPPEVMSKMLVALDALLDIDKLFPAIKTKAVPRHTFMDLYAGEADVIVFTGKYENAQIVHRQCPRSLLVYNGSGINPFILFDDADVDLAVAKAVEMRCFNSGQDCAGTDAYFVPKQLGNAFCAKLEDALRQIKVGPSTDPEVKVSRTMKEAYLTELETYLEHDRKHITFGGTIDIQNHYVYPTIIRKQASQHIGDFHEFFAPVFYVLEYADTNELDSILMSPIFTERTMYISIFGNNPTLEAKLTYARVLKNQIINDVEQGNHEYGGWGSKANFLLYGGKKVVRPILISRDMHELLR